MIKQRVAIANRVLGNWYNTLGIGSILMTFGHVSERIATRDQFYVRGRPRVDDLLIKTTTNEIIAVDFSANKLDGSSSVSMPGETKLHSFIYRNRKDVKSVCHAHSHFCVLAADLGLKLKPMCNEGIDLFPVKLYNNNALISTDEHGTDLVRSLGKANACLLRGHGAVTVADSCEVAVIRMMQLEEQARLNLYAFMAKGLGYEGIAKNQAKGYIQAASASLRRSGLSEESIRNQISGRSLWTYLVEQVANDV